MDESTDRDTRERMRKRRASLLNDWWSSLNADMAMVLDRHRRDLVDRLGVYTDELARVAERIENIAPRAGTIVRTLSTEVGSFSERLDAGEWREAAQTVRKTIAANPLFAIAGAICGGALVSLTERHGGLDRYARANPSARTDIRTEH